MSIKHLHIDRTPTSPEMLLDLERGTMDITGRSLPANGEQFYGHVHRWLDEYLKQPCASTTVNIRLDFMDSTSSKHFYNIFNRLSVVEQPGREVNVNWHFEIGDEEMAEVGKDYQRFFPIHFRFIGVKDLF